MSTVRLDHNACNDRETVIKEAHRSEREMTRHQRNLVDTCFEEGQFEAAIAVIDQLRSSKYRPASPHIRQLLYIALYPPQPDNGGEPTDGYPMSPKKAVKQQKSPLYPSAAAAVAAQRLLVSLAHTNTPNGLFQALPSYVEGNNSTGSTTTFDFEEEDSVVGKESVCIKESKNCWAILKEGFIRRKTFTISSPKPKGNNKRTRRNFHDDNSLSDDTLDTPAIVATNAWPVLDWMISIFELNEAEQVDNGLPRYSTLLLTQIPSPRGGPVARWEVDTPLEICFYCFQQADQRHKSAGARLLTLLINLTATIYLDMPMFVTSVFTRLSTFTAEEISDLFLLLAPTPIICKFKIALCQKHITGMSSGSSTGVSDSRPKPQARAQPRSVASGRQPIGLADKTPQSFNSASIASRNSPPTSAEILRLLDMHSQTSSTSPSFVAFIHMKFELVVAFGNLQTSIAAEERDLEWSNMLHDGRLDKTLDAAFGHDSEEYCQTCRKALKGVVSLWRAVDDHSE